MKYNDFDKHKSGIYVIRNLKNNKMYVGKSINIDQRIKQHTTLLNRKSKDENPHLINAWYLYGKSNFDYFVVEYCIPEQLKEKEYYWILLLNTIEKGYNLRLDSSTNCIVSKETRKKQSDSQKKRYEDIEERKKVSHTFWKDNPDKKEEMAIKVSKTNTNFSILQFDRNMNLIKEYPTQKYLRNNYPKLYLPAILQVCNGHKASYLNFLWRYKDIQTGTIIHHRIPRTRRLKVSMIDKITNKVIKEFSHSNEAAKYIGVASGGNINNMCKNKLIQKSKNYYFRYSKDIVQSIEKSIE